MTISIESLQIDAIIGLLDFEREFEQRIIVDLEACYDFKNDNFIDYALLADMIKRRLKTMRYRLLEEALLDLEKTILETYPTLTTLKLKISKPDILKNCTVALSHNWEYPQFPSDR